MKKILIVSSLKPLIKKEQSILDRAEFKIFVAGSGEEALNMHRTERMDLIITDLDLPGINGDELCSAIRENNRLKKVSIIIICSGKDSDLERCSVSGANSCIIRPLNPAELLEKVSLLLNIPERKSYRVLIKVEVKGKFMNMPFFCSSQNLSASGILLETDKPLAKGDIISCSFFLPNSERIVAEGEVVRVIRTAVNTFQYGVKFLNLDLESASAVGTFIGNWKSAQS